MVVLFAAPTVAYFTTGGIFSLSLTPFDRFQYLSYFLFDLYIFRAMSVFAVSKYAFEISWTVCVNYSEVEFQVLPRTLASKYPVLLPLKLVESKKPRPEPRPLNGSSEVIVIDESDDDVEVIEKKAEVWRTYYENADTIVVRPDITIDANRRGQERTPVPVKIDRDVIGWCETFKAIIVLLFGKGEGTVAFESNSFIRLGL